MTTPNDVRSTLGAYLDIQARKFKLDLEAARLFVGTTDIGNVAEHAVRGFLASVLPARYRVGVGEAIAPTGQQPDRIDQTQQKDVLIYDPYWSAVFGWDESGINLFPVESIYAVLEVKTSIRSTDDLRNAVEQALEAKRLCQQHRPDEQTSPFTGVFAFESGVLGPTLFNVLAERAPAERVDFVFILHPRGPSAPENSEYIAHWHYYERGGGRIDFVSADATAEERTSSPDDPDNKLTLGESESALLWFYLFLVEELAQMRLQPANLSAYALSTKQHLGWKSNE